MKKYLVLLSACCMSLTLKAQLILVDQNATGANTGSSWENAYTDLQDALGSATAGDVIWVAKGEYKPTATSNRDISFVIPDSVKVYGGFSATEASNFDLLLRDFSNNETVLSGNIGSSGSFSDNSFHVVRTNYVSQETLLNGFTIADGNADDGMIGIPEVLGGGFFNNADGTGNESNPTVKNCIFRSNYAVSGGGFYNFGRGGVAKSTIINCRFENNSSRSGGGILNNGQSGGEASATVINSVFYNNTATWDGGGVMNFSTLNSANFSKYINCTFSNNTANLDGDDMFNQENSGGNTQIELTNSIIVNSTSGAIPIVNEGGVNLSISYSLAKGSGCNTLGSISCGGGMVYDPSFTFIDISNGDLRLPYDSKAKKKGSNAFVITDFDIAGTPRIIDGIVDIGAYEYKSDVYTYVNKNATGTNDGTSWQNAFTDLQGALALGTGDRSIWVAKGTYFPSTANRFTPFIIPDSVKVYGGFKGNEELSFDLDHRDLFGNETILSGDYLSTPNDDSDNSYNVVKTVNVSPQTVLDGFTISDGNANKRFGTLNNRGAGWFNDGSGDGNESSPTINRCEFRFNKSLNRGGAFFNNASSNGIANPSFTGCLFLSNSSTYGGAISSITDRATGTTSGGGANPSFVNCGFSLNKGEIGGAIYIVATSATSNIYISHCSFYGNSVEKNPDNNLFYADKGDALFARGLSGNVTTTIVNSIFFRNADRESLFLESPWYNVNASTNISYSYVTTNNCIELDEGDEIHSVTCGGGMLYSIDDPLFVDAENGDLRVQGTSPVIDIGLSQSSVLKQDALLRNRLIGSTVDLGPYEYINRSYVKADAIGKNNGSSWEDAFLYPSLATLEADAVWVAKGTYKPSYKNDKSDFIKIKSGQQFLGGFVGNEPSNYFVPFRDIKGNQTIISGNIGDPSDSTDNSAKLIKTTDVGNETLISGLTLTGAYNTSFLAAGGAIENNQSLTSSINSVPKIEDCLFLNNYSSVGGAYGSLQGRTAGAIFKRCQFVNNNANYGGAIGNFRNLEPNSPLTFNQCTFERNQATEGGVFYVTNAADVKVVNSKFYNNRASKGSVAYVGRYTPLSNNNNFKSKLSFSFCTLAGNNASNGATIDAITDTNFNTTDSTLVTIDNSILWNNNAAGSPNYATTNNANVFTISYSIVNETSCSSFESTDNIVNCGAGMIYNLNPEMLDKEAGFFQLRCNSPAIDNADPASILSLDLVSNKRGVLKDIGAYEYDSYLYLNEELNGGINPQVSEIERINLQSSILNTNNSLFQGSKSVLLQPGFEISPSAGNESVFRAEIGGSCP